MSTISDSDSDDLDYTAPPTPPLPEVHRVKEFVRRHRRATTTLKTLKALIEEEFLKPKNEYQYDALGEDQIRILELKKGEGDQLIECSLIPMRLPRRHLPRFKYQALSYVWGSDDPRSEIRIWDAKLRPTPASIGTGVGRNWRLGFEKALEEARLRAVENADIRLKKFYVRENLYLALKQFRQKDRDLWLWVDAVCIDQSNTKEKSKQLSRMHEIYNKAYNVCIWLGPRYEDGKSDRAINFIDRAVDLRLLDGLVSLTDSPETLADRATDWSCLAELMNASWFSRRWVVQEVALARNASLHCGDKQIHWYNFADAVANFVAKLDAVRRLYKKVNIPRLNPDSLAFVESLGAKVMVATTSNLFRKSDDGDILERRFDLETLVSKLGTFEAGNPRDLIYALLSLAKDSPLIEAPPRSQSDSRNLLRPDYGKQALEVYTDFVRNCVSSGSLDVICRHWAIPYREESSVVADSARQKLFPIVQLPTWIGLLENSPFPHQLTGRANGDSLVGAPSEHKYNACDGEAPRVEYEIKYLTPSNRRMSITGLSEPGSLSDRDAVSPVSAPAGSRRFDVTLRCKGVKLATVRKLSARMVNATILKECLDMGGWERDESGNLPRRVPDKLWRTLCADRGPDGQNPPSWYHRACLHCLATSSPSGDVNTGELIHDEHSPDLMVEYLKRVQCVVWSRKVLEAVSEKDQQEQLFGLASDKTRVGDIICILFGCTVPVILRRGNKAEHGEYYEFIGESYIHGKMDGEALSGLSQHDLDSQVAEFRIR